MGEYRYDKHCEAVTKIVVSAAKTSASFGDCCVRPECHKVILIHHGARYHQYLPITLSNLFLLEIVCE